MTLVVGADRSALVLFLVTDGSVRGAMQIDAPAQGRNELAAITDFLSGHNVDWEALEELAVVRLPTSTTSVRVVETLMRTAGWYQALPIRYLGADTLDAITADTVDEQLESAELRP